jgi:predicted dehydrogenase
MGFSRRDFLRSGTALLATQLPARSAVNDRVAIGFIGTGARGQELIEAVKKHPTAEITGLCDAYTGRIARSLDRTDHRPKVYQTPADLLADKSIDAVFVATPDHLHSKIVMDALRAGKDVYCEKPMTYSIAEGHAIIQAARAGKRIVQVGSQGVSSDLQQKARAMITSGWLGTTTTVRAFCNRNTVNGAWIYPIPPDASPKTVNWDMFQGDRPKRPFSLERFFRWRCYEDYSGGIPSDLFVHLCTTIHYLLDVPAPTRVMAMGQRYRWGFGREVPDTVNAILEYPRGFVVNLSATFNNQSSTALHFLGTEGTLKLEGDGLEFEPEEPLEDNRWIISSWPKPFEDAYYRRPEVRLLEVGPDGLSERKEADKDDDKDKDKIQELEEPLRNPDQPHRFKSDTNATVVHVGNFLNSIHTRQPFWEDATAGHRAAACAHMINLSIKEKRMVEWDFEKDDVKR